MVNYTAPGEERERLPKTKKNRDIFLIMQHSAVKRQFVPELTEFRPTKKCKSEEISEEEFSVDHLSPPPSSSEFFKYNTTLSSSTPQKGSSGNLALHHKPLLHNKMSPHQRDSGHQLRLVLILERYIKH